MKTYITIVLAVVLALAVFSVGLAQVKALPSSGEPTCKIVTYKPNEGKATVLISPSGEEVEASVGQVLRQYDVVRTDSLSYVTIEFPGGSTISLKPGTAVTIDDLLWNDAAKRIRLNMSSGELRSIISRVNTPSEFRIQTPTAICGARGTVFYVKVTDTTTSVYVGEGSVDVVNPITGDTYSVIGGTLIVISLDGQTSGPVEAADTDITGWTAYYSDTAGEPYTPPAPSPMDSFEAPSDTPESVASQT